MDQRPGVYWRQRPDGRWEYAEAGGHWRLQDSPVEVISQSQAGWRQGPSGWEYLASDGRWYAHQAQRVTKAKGGEFDFHPAGGYVAAAGGVIVAMSSILPWWSASALSITVTRNGYQLGANRGFSPDGVIVLVLGLFLLAVGIGGIAAPYGGDWLRTRGIGIAATIGAGLAFLLMILEIAALNGSVRSDPIASLSYGLWFLGVGAVAGGVGGLMMAVMPRRRPTD